MWIGIHEYIPPYLVIPKRFHFPIRPLPRPPHASSSRYTSSPSSFFFFSSLLSPFLLSSFLHCSLEHDSGRWLDPLLLHSLPPRLLPPSSSPSFFFILARWPCEGRVNEQYYTRGERERDAEISSLLSSLLPHSVPPGPLVEEPLGVIIITVDYYWGGEGERARYHYFCQLLRKSLPAVHLVICRIERFSRNYFHTESLIWSCAFRCSRNISIDNLFAVRSILDIVSRKVF